MKYRKKPVVIEAEQFLPHVSPLPFADRIACAKDEYGWYVVTIHGNRCPIAVGDWIIPEPDGNHYYPVKPDIFAATYDPEPPVSVSPATSGEAGDVLDRALRIVGVHVGGTLHRWLAGGERVKLIEQVLYALAAKIIELDDLERTGYPASARVIALHLKEFCDESLTYPNMIADAARKAAAELATLRERIADRDRLCYSQAGTIEGLQQSEAALRAENGRLTREQNISAAATYIGAIADANSTMARGDPQTVDHMVKAGYITPDRAEVQAALNSIASKETRSMIRASWKRLGLAAASTPPTKEGGEQ